MSFKLNFKPPGKEIRLSSEAGHELQNLSRKLHGMVNLELCTLHTEPLLVTNFETLISSAGHLPLTACEFCWPPLRCGQVEAVKQGRAFEVNHLEIPDSEGFRVWV